MLEARKLVVTTQRAFGRRVVERSVISDEIYQALA